MRKLHAHLSAEEFRDFVLEDLPGGDQAEVDAHVERCLARAKRLEEYYLACESFPESEWAARRPTVIASLRLNAFLSGAGSRISAAWEWFRSLPENLSVAANARPAAPLDRVALARTESAGSFEDVSRDGLFGVSARVDRPAGSLVLRVDSRALECEGCVLVIGDRNWSRASALKRVTTSSVGAEIVVRGEECGSIPQETRMNIAAIRPEIPHAGKDGSPRPHEC